VEGGSGALGRGRGGEVEGPPVRESGVAKVKGGGLRKEEETGLARARALPFFIRKLEIMVQFKFGSLSIYLSSLQGPILCGTPPPIPCLGKMKCTASFRRDHFPYSWHTGLGMGCVSQDPQDPKPTCPPRTGS
jgi:hypothetical protein